MEVLLVAAGALAATAVAVPVCIVVARRWGVMDRPGPLKTKRPPCPTWAGWPFLPVWWSADGSVGPSP